MFAWFSNWKKSNAAPPPAPPSGAASEPCEAAAAAAPAPPAGGSRRPLIDREGRLAGFEFRVPVVLESRLRDGANPIVQAAHAAAVFESMRRSMQSHPVAIFTLPLSIAVRPAVLEQVPAGVMLALADGPWNDPASLDGIDRLRKAGASLGGCAMPLAGGQFVLIDGRDAPFGNLQRHADNCRRLDPRSQVIVTGLANVDDLEAALQHGADLAAGSVDRRRSADEAVPVSAGVQRLCRLLNSVLQDEELKVLCEDLRTDIDLSYRLLRFANSPLLGLTRTADSVEQAVMLIGRDGLYRWLMLLMLAGAPNRPSSRALQEVALARARLLEWMAPKLGAPAPALFTTGLLSMLEVVMRQPLSEALRPLQLPLPATQALVEHAGPWNLPLQLAQALERDDMQTAEALSLPFGGLDVVAAQAETAWAWASDAASIVRAP
jgi:EAL and modified HD-GYP domain-containing signal transduction protein